MIPILIECFITQRLIVRREKKVPKRRAAKDARRRYVNAISGATSENINIQVKPTENSRPN